MTLSLLDMPRYHAGMRFPNTNGGQLFEQVLPRLNHQRHAMAVMTAAHTGVVAEVAERNPIAFGLEEFLVRPSKGRQGLTLLEDRGNR